MYTPPKPVIVPKVVNTDLPCATNPSAPQPSKPAPIYQPGATKPPIVPVPTAFAPVPTAAAGTSAFSNPAPTVASLNSQLSEATLTISKASLALGFTGPARDFLAFAQNLAIELKVLRAKK